ncbi:MAG: arginine--tRNA ligase, partial [Solirubrobacteraceae bacterium]
MNPIADLRRVVARAAADVAGDDAPLDQLRVERARRAGQGDYSTNAAMLLAPGMGAAPREIAQRIGKALAGAMGDHLISFEVAGPGFVNLSLSDGWHRAALRDVLRAGDRFGGGGAAPARRVLVEFVSANPTGPLVAASGRHAAYGDALSRILAHHGHEVRREYYFNDAGGQIRLLGESVRARAREEQVPEGGYQGDYVVGLAAE